MGTNLPRIAKLRSPSYCVIPYQAFEAAGFEQDLPINEIKGTICDHVFQCINTLNVIVDMQMRHTCMRLVEL